jgi:hypothetical protein
MSSRRKIDRFGIQAVAAARIESSILGIDVKNGAQA